MHEKAKGKALCTGKVRTATGAGAAAGAVEQLLHNETDAPFEWLRHISGHQSRPLWAAPTRARSRARSAVRRCQSSRTTPAGSACAAGPPRYAGRRCTSIEQCQK
jgi:hypothetical protein